jgi:RNA polymerase primary sigma factor
VNELLSKHFEIDGDDSQDDGDPYRMERISSDGSVEDAATEKILLRQLISIVETPGLLTPRQDEVVNLVFGLKSGIPLTYEEAGEELGITRQAISAILHTALLRLLPVAKAHSLEEYL